MNDCYCIFILDTFICFIKKSEVQFLWLICNYELQNKLFIQSFWKSAAYVNKFDDKNFMFNSKLKFNLNTHNGEKPYICSHCGIFFLRTLL